MKSFVKSVLAIVAAGSLYASAQAASDLGLIYSDHSEMKVSGYTGGLVAKFPVLVRISEARIPNFKYERAGATGEHIAFTSCGEICPYEIESWNPNGESLVWVRVPELMNGTKIDFWWYPWENAKEPENHPSEVWNGYAAVWHLDEDIAADGTTVSGDATVNKLNATPDAGSHGNLARMQETIGVVGKARTIETQTPGTWGNHLVVDGEALEEQHLGGTFTYSVWVKFTGYQSWPILASRKASNQGAGGWAIEHSTSRKVFCVRGNNSSSFNAEAFAAEPNTLNEYTHLVFVYDGPNARVYSNGELVAEKLDLNPVIDNNRALYLGGGYTETANPEYSICGSLDEMRLHSRAVSADWAKAEYETIAKDDFIIAKAAVLENVWSVEPNIEPRDWECASDPVITVTNGRLQNGAIATPVFHYTDDPENTFTEVSSLNRVGDVIASFVVTNGTEEVKKLIPLTIYSPNPNTYSDLGGTASGRVLLGNNDRIESAPIAGQGRWETDPAMNTYWAHTDVVNKLVNFPHLGDEVTHVLYKQGGSVLWRLKQVWMGSTYVGETKSAAYNYLPYSSTSSGRTSGTAEISPEEASVFALRNVKDAYIASPLYVDGVDTIYFDAVNAYKSDNGSKIVVEIATKNSKGEVASDENCFGEDDPFYYLTHTATGAGLAASETYWKRVTPIVLKKGAADTDFTVDTTQTLENDEIKLAITEGGTDQAFYRIVVNLGTREPVRFRIRRVGTSGGARAANQILIDNILAAPPATTLKVTPPGGYDKSITGKQELGFQCAFSTPFPSRAETNLYGRAHLQFSPSVSGVLTDYIERAELKWRWRYLNQAFDPDPSTGSDWHSEPFDLDSLEGEVLSTKNPLALNGNPGDIEWYYDFILKAPAFKFVDYSGLDLDDVAVARSERKIEAHAEPDPGDRYASGGKEWFLRLREGESDYQRMQVEISGSDDGIAAMLGKYEMELIEDHLWRAFVAVPTNATGTCKFEFHAYNKQVKGATEIVRDETSFGSAYVESKEKSGTLVELGEPIQFDVDHVAGYVEFKMSDRFMSYQIGRAEYQDFNNWNDAHTSSDRFKIDSTDTNSVDVAAMKFYEAPTGTWPLFESVSQSAREFFTLNDYNTEGPYKKEIFHDESSTPNTAWKAQNITFVSENFVGKDEASQSRNSGLAGKLLGSGKGMMDYSSADTPLGIEKISLKARIGQSMTFSSFSTLTDNSKKKNYTFICPATMSRDTPENGNSAGDMAVGASTSVVGYYRATKGCYEFRVERLFSGTTIRLSLYKWVVNGETSEAKCLASQDFSGRRFWTQRDNSSGEVKPNFYGLMITLINETGANDVAQTHIIAGLTDARDMSNLADPQMIYETFGEANASGEGTVPYIGLDYIDTDSPHTMGTYGVGAKDCHAEFVLPFHYDSPVVTSTNRGGNPQIGSGSYFNGSNNKFVLGDDYVPDWNEIDDVNWDIVGDRLQPYTAEFPKWRGFMVATNVSQKLDLYLKPRGAGADKWEKVDTIETTSYNFEQLAFTNVMRKGSFDIRLRTNAAKSLDVVVDDIQAYKWQGDDIRSSSDTTWHYTQCYIETNEVAKTNFVRLQPARTEAKRPLAIRSPLMNGLGKFTFNYDPDTINQNAEVWVQVATNDVVNNIYGSTGYNESIKAIDLKDGVQEDVDEWITVKKFKYTGAEEEDGNLVGGDSKTVYLGWHDNENRPMRGIYRLFVPTHVVTAAEIASTNATRNVEYGTITITRVSCTDEPGVSDRSWRAWNMRTLGDANDSERRMSLGDMKLSDGGSGLVAALNNSTCDVEDREGRPLAEDDARLVSLGPTIYAPTMKNLNADDGVGQISFKARLYARPGETVEGNGGKITAYGSFDSTGETGWTKLETFNITTTVFSNYTWQVTGTPYRAVKFVIDDPSAKTGDAATARVVLDELVISERVKPTIAFKYARPFRNDLLTTTPIADILSPREQPLHGESWGIQTQLALQQLTDEIDLERGMKVYLSYFRGEAPWGYQQWRDNSAAKSLIPLTLVDEENLIYRSVGAVPESFVSASVGESGQVVQFMLLVEYTDRHGVVHNDPQDLVTMGTGWLQPEWYHPVDHNRDNNPLATKDKPYDSQYFSAYTILDTVSPGRAWINEVNWNDGDEGEEAPIDHQFIEICVPAGVDMTGWEIRATDYEANQTTIANFGTGGIPSKKEATANAYKGYEFLVLRSPATADAGNIPEADGSWARKSFGNDVVDGTLAYNRPYQLELIRPSGVIEQQFVLDGTNTLAEYDWAYMWDGTNLVETLDEDDPSPKRFYAGRELAHKLGESLALASIGVTRGEDSEDTTLWPGAAKTWTESLDFTPGKLNVGQEIPDNWFILANGTTAWLSFKTISDHIRYRFGDGDEWKTGTTTVLVSEGNSTNVTFAVDSFHKGKVTEAVNDGEPVTRASDFRETTITFEPERGARVSIEAGAAIEDKLVGEFKLTEENRFTPAVMKWLLTKYGEGYGVDDIRLADYKGINNEQKIGQLTLTEMYWLDIPPVAVTEEEKAMPQDEALWVFRYGQKYCGDHIIDYQLSGDDAPSAYTNKQVMVTMYSTNVCTHAVSAPKYLQGLNNERSDAYVAGEWDAATLQLVGKVDLSLTDIPFLPFRLFVFDEHSFSGVDGDDTIVSASGEKLPAYSALIDVLDPFKQPIGKNYDWDKYPNTKAFFGSTISEKTYPYTIEVLRPKSTY